MDTNHIKQGDLVIPGDCLCTLSEHTSGSGTYIRGTNIYSLYYGKVHIESALKGESTLSQIAVTNHKIKSNSVPDIGSLVICKVVNISERQAKVNIINVEGSVLQQSLNGVIRKSDVREMEKDTVIIFDSFRPGDLVRARVISLGEGYQYILSTAENELGVFVGKSENGAILMPTSWCEMQCSKTGLREKRKVAKVANAIPLK